MYLIQMLLPVGSNAVDTATGLNRTQRELIDRFGGVTAYLQTPAKGQWADVNGTTTVDRVFLVEVVANEFDKHWWREYANALATRFGQDVMHIRALRIELLDPIAA